MGEGNSDTKIIKIICWTVGILIVLAVVAFGLLIGSVGRFVKGIIQDNRQNLTGEFNGAIAGILDFDDEGLDGAFVDSGAYSVSADGISTIKLDWISGSVTIEAYDGDEIVFTEQWAKDIDLDHALRYGTYNGTLKIHYCREDSLSLVDFDDYAGKMLTLRVPSALAASLASLEIRSASADVNASGLHADDLSIETISGRVNVGGLGADELSIDTVSGSVACTGACSANELDLDTISGSAELSGEFMDIDLDTVSGNIAVACTDCPRELKSNSVSGNVTLALPQSGAFGFTARFESISGTFNSTFPVTLSGGEITYSDGSAKFKAESVSGNFSVVSQ